MKGLKVIIWIGILLAAVIIFIYQGFQGMSTGNPQKAHEDTLFVKLADLSNGFSFDMKYATSDNFIKQKVYDCDDCILRKEVAQALVKANRHFLNKGYRLKFYDCYRPLDVQKKFWEAFPDDNYVANPYTTGSVHNRGGAVDLTLVDLEGNELNMGTGFDYFGEETHHDFKNLPSEVLANRKLLKEGLEMAGFSAIETEWWHYNYNSANQYPISNFKVDCNN